MTVAAVIEREGRFLLVQERVSGESVFNQPAGHLDEGESLLAAVIRETREESAWEFVPQAIVGIYQWRHPHKDKTFIRVTFCGDAVQHDPHSPLDEGIEATHWLTLDEIRDPQRPLRSPMVLRSIDDYLSHTRYPLSLLAVIE